MIFTDYKLYSKAVASGQRNVRFVSLLDHTVSTRNPVTDDRGLGVDSFRGVAGCSA